MPALSFRTLRAGLTAIWRKAARATWTLLTIAVPVALATRLLDQLGLIKPLAVLLKPFMVLLGLPGEAAVVWIMSMGTSIYGGLAAFGTLAPRMGLTAEQATILATAILVAHSLPVEAGVARKAGVRLGFTLAWRILGGFLAAWSLSVIYRLLPAPLTVQGIAGDGGGDPASGLKIAWDGLLSPVLGDNVAALWHGWPLWLWEQLLFAVEIFAVIFALMIFMKLLELTGILRFIRQLLGHLLRWVGIGPDAAPLTLIGMILGITYGGGLIIEEARTGHLKERDVFLSLGLLGLGHGIIEDSILMLQFMGAHWSGTLLWRVVFTFAAMIVLARWLRQLSDPWFHKLCFHGRGESPKISTSKSERS
jgi:spore maturation protein SpmB